MNTPYDFDECLAESHSAEDLPFWAECYRKAFPTMAAMVNHRKDGEHQRAGIDRSVVLDNGKTLWIDEKFRRRNRRTGKVYDDIALEYVSNDQRNTPGWVCKPLLADYIAYAIGPLGKCYLLPVSQLQSVWNQYGSAWLSESDRYKFATENRGYKTLNVVVTPAELFPLIGNCLRVTFEPYDPDAAVELPNRPKPKDQESIAQQWLDIAAQGDA
jgi:hypothetical protein